jgi:tRNA-modifying protein YgfZ
MVGAPPMPTTDLRSELLSAGPCLRPDAPFQLLRLSGPDAGEFLQRLCTQDVLGLGDGALRPAAFLDAKGKLQATCQVGRLGAEYWLAVDSEQIERLAALLERYHFTEKLTQAAVASRCHETIAALVHPAGPGTIRSDGAACELTIERRGLTFVRRHELGSSASAFPVGAPAATAECLRMVAGFVRVGLDTEPTTLALEADLDDHCSTTKGCYTGQEIVARIHTYGHVNRKLCLLRLPAGDPIAAPMPLHDDDAAPVGRVMRALVAPNGAFRLGTGYLPRDFQALGTTLRLLDGTSVEVVGYPAS